MDNNKMYKEMMRIINKIIKMPINKIEEMISILENKPSYSVTFPLANDFNDNEVKVLKKIVRNNKNLRELLEFILSMKIIKEA